MKALKLTPLDLQHVSLLASLHKACFDHSWKQCFLENLLTNSKPPCFNFGWISFYGRTATGFMLARHLITDIEILTFCVLPAFQRQGIGKALLNKLIDQFPYPIFLETSIDNQASCHLYQQHGFIIIGKRKNYYTSNTTTDKDAYLMQRTP